MLSRLAGTTFTLCAICLSLHLQDPETHWFCYRNRWRHSRRNLSRPQKKPYQILLFSSPPPPHLPIFGQTWEEVTQVDTQGRPLRPPNPERQAYVFCDTCPFSSLQPCLCDGIWQARSPTVSHPPPRSHPAR